MFSIFILNKKLNILLLLKFHVVLACSLFSFALITIVVSKENLKFYVISESYEPA